VAGISVKIFTSGASCLGLIAVRQRLSWVGRRYSTGGHDSSQQSSPVGLFSRCQCRAAPRLPRWLAKVISAGFAVRAQMFKTS